MTITANQNQPVSADNPVSQWAPKGLHVRYAWDSHVLGYLNRLAPLTRVSLFVKADLSCWVIIEGSDFTEWVLEETFREWFEIPNTERVVHVLLTSENKTIYVLSREKP